MNRIILHINFDMFFAAVEILEKLSLKDKPEVVALDVRRGIIEEYSDVF